MWIGTMSGLNRYDGYHFTVFRHQVNDTTSLSDNFITSIYPFPHQRLWINTRNGADIYDPRTESFCRNYLHELQTLGLPPGTVAQIIRDRQQRYWFLYDLAYAPAAGNLYCYDSRTQTSHLVLSKKLSNTGLLSDSLTSITLDRWGNVWVIDWRGRIAEINAQTLQIGYQTDRIARNSTRVGNYSLFVDRDGGLWAYPTQDAAGVFYYNPASQQYIHFSKSNLSYPLNNDIVYGIIQDRKGNIWVGTDHGGINIIHLPDFRISYVLNQPDDDKSLSQNSVYALFRDASGIIWVGTYKKGFCYYNEQFDRFPLYKHWFAHPAEWGYDDVNRFVEDAEGNLWIGSNGGGLIYFDRKQNIFRQYVHRAGDPHSLSNNVIVSLCLDRQGKLWIGTYYGGLDCFDGHRFIHYRHRDDDPYSLAGDKVWDILQDRQGRLWIGTLGQGLDRLDPETGHFIHYALSDPHATALKYISVLLQDRQGRLWIGTAGGVDVMDPSSGRILAHYGHQEGNPHALSNDNVISLCEDSRGWMWIGTREGLNLLNPATGIIQQFYQKDGLPDNAILTILEDPAHQLWMGTPNGLCNLQISQNNGKWQFHFRNFDELDGLQGREFNEKAAYRLREGLLAFGGPNGFNLFDPSHIEISREIPPIVLTNLQIFNHEVRVGEKIKGHVILKQALTQTRSLVLPYNANDFSIEFAALGYTPSIRNGYAYKLEGFNRDWIYTDGSQRKAVYTNLNPGHYVLHVVAANNDGVWDTRGTTLDITILPPFWRTIWAYLLYAAFLIGCLWLARKILLDRARMHFQLQQQQLEAQRMHELDMMKIRFFTNVSHEFRTPLTLILTPVERLLKQEAYPELQKQLQLIYRNARRLLLLVNQLLDFRKLETQSIPLHLAEADVVAYVRELAMSFMDIADRKQIAFTIETNLSSLQMAFDADKLERIVFNLLSNAFKFTPVGGSVVLRMEHVMRKDEAQQDQPYFLLSVIDSGIGIPEEKQPYIFERFFQHDVPPEIMNQGSGIGLSITREFVRMHGGEITVKSAPGNGSRFDVWFPVKSLPSTLETAPWQVSRIPVSQASVKPAEENARHKPTILLIEDNDDFRFYLKDNLQLHYRILEAADGQAGWEKALHEHPALIVSDIMMPGMDGIALAKKLKADPRTAEIPLILLTARAGDEQQIEGLDAGANDYLVKPFNFEILQTRIRNLLREKRRAQKLQPPSVDLTPPMVQMPPEDEQFLEKARKAVEKHLQDPGFSVTKFSQELYMSRAALYKRIVALTGKSPLEFIRRIRLEHARQLLAHSRMTVSEVAYSVGFNNPKYFTRYFKEAFQILPSEYQQQMRAQQASVADDASRP
ncbi:MAG: helix-turn-helix domain-containing protein [Thermoflavifilum sp.]|nr:helix-turn-helix domain-containing protein [Thermoflavifilum sp.]